MACLITKPISKQHTRLSTQLETIQSDLSRLSWFISQLSGLPDNELAAVEISDQLQTIHNCLNRFEARCMAIQITAYEDESDAPVNEESFETNFPEINDWTTVQREARHANKLARQLTSSLSKIRIGLGEHRITGAIPEDIDQINRVVGNAVNGLTSEWNTNLE